MKSTRVALNRGNYIDAALLVISEVGVDKLSLRKVATQLGVSPMAMYKHFPGKEELLAAAFDQFIARAEVIPDNALPWDEWVEQAVRAMYQALCSEMSWVPHLGSLPMGIQASAVTDAFVKKLTGAGFTLEQAIEAYYALIQVAIGAVCLRASLGSDNIRSPKPGDISPLTRSYLQQANTDRLAIAPIQDSLLKRDQIDIGLPLLLDALRMRIGDTGEQ